MATSPSDGVAGAIPVDVAVVGAGPAGMSAVVAAADAGATVALVDAEPAMGGQFWRHPAPAEGPGAVRDREVAGLHHHLRRYRALRDAIAGHVAAGRVTHLARHEVWSVSRTGEHPTGPRFTLRAVTGSGARRVAVTVTARALVLATGAYDLQLPFPGWDLPGVMTAGGVQLLLKGHAVLAGRRVVVAGTGPFLAGVASGLVRNGGQVLGVFEAARPAAWLREPASLLASGPKLLEGMGIARDLLRHRVGYHPGWTVLGARGGDSLESVTVAPVGRDGRPRLARSRDLEVDVLAVGWGFVPRLDLPLALGCATAPGCGARAVVVVDTDRRTTSPGVYAAGEICGIAGAAPAVVEGGIAGAAAAHETGAAAPDPRARAAAVRRAAALRTFAAAMARAYPVPPHWTEQVADDTLVCRCEEVTAGAIREVAREDGAADQRTAKLLVRAGMGWCQGRICGYATDCIAAAAGGARPAFRPVERAVAAPVPLSVVAQPDSPRS